MVANSVIDKLKFRFVRGNTLYFDVELKNEIQQKKILGRFNLFYRTRGGFKKKGKIYGFMIDEIQGLEVEK